MHSMWDQSRGRSVKGNDARLFLLNILSIYQQQDGSHQPNCWNTRNAAGVSRCNNIRRWSSKKKTNGTDGTAKPYTTLNMSSLKNKHKMAHLHWPWAYLSRRALPTRSTNPFSKLITDSKYSIVLLSLGRNSIAKTNNITASALLWPSH